MDDVDAHADVDDARSLRPLLFSIAYGMTGSVQTSEDLVQEALLRLHRVESEGREITSRKAYASAVLTHLAIDLSRSARVQRESYVGAWLPEPIATEATDDPWEHAELSEALSMALLVVLERLTATERAVFLLHDVFGFPFVDVAGQLGRTEASCRQLAVRARRRIADSRPPLPAGPAPPYREQQELVARFLVAAEQGDVDQLAEFLAADVVLHGDGGGKARALARPVVGRADVARQLVGFARVARGGGIRLEPARVNGAAGLWAIDADGAVVGVVAVTISAGRVTAVHSVVNPDKLRHLASPRRRRGTE